MTTVLSQVKSLLFLWENGIARLLNMLLLGTAVVRMIQRHHTLSQATLAVTKHTMKGRKLLTII
jgi:hypothetical protein